MTDHLPSTGAGEHGVLLWSGLVCPAASEAVAVEQAERVGGIACRITPVPPCRQCAALLSPGRRRFCGPDCRRADRLAYWRARYRTRRGATA